MKVVTVAFIIQNDLRGDVCVHGWRYQHHQQYMPKEILEKFASPSILKGTL